jgi:hypothetical protein
MCAYCVIIGELIYTEALLYKKKEYNKDLTLTAM